MFRRTQLIAIGVLVSLGACTTTTMSDTGPGPTVLSVVPAANATGVSANAPVVLTFSMAMMQGMEANVFLHEKDATGTVVPGTFAWSADRKTLTFMPSTPLRAATTYVLHLAPTMMSADGQAMDHGGCTALGGQTIMSGGMMGGGMMGSGATGMIFRFTTG